MSIRHIYRSGSTRVHKCLRCPYTSEYGSTLQTPHVYVSICIWEACERCLLMEFSVMKLIGIDFDIISMFYSFNDAFVSSWVYKMFMGIDWLLSNYHNMPPQAQHILMRCRRCWCLCGDNGFIRISAGLFTVGIWCSMMLPAIILFLV